MFGICSIAGPGPFPRRRHKNMPRPIPRPRTRSMRCVIHCMSCGRSTTAATYVIEELLVALRLDHQAAVPGERLRGRFGMVLSIDDPTPRQFAERYDLAPRRGPSLKPLMRIWRPTHVSASSRLERAECSWRFTPNLGLSDRRLGPQAIITRRPTLTTKSNFVSCIFCRCSFWTLRNNRAASWCTLERPASEDWRRPQPCPLGVEATMASAKAFLDGQRGIAVVKTFNEVPDVQLKARQYPGPARTTYDHVLRRRTSPALCMRYGDSAGQRVQRADGR